MTIVLLRNLQDSQWRTRYYVTRRSANDGRQDIPCHRCADALWHLHGAAGWPSPSNLWSHVLYPVSPAPADQEWPAVEAAQAGVCLLQKTHQADLARCQRSADQPSGSQHPSAAGCWQSFIRGQSVWWYLVFRLTSTLRQKCTVYIYKEMLLYIFLNFSFTHIYTTSINVFIACAFLHHLLPPLCCNIARC